MARQAKDTTNPAKAVKSAKSAADTKAVEGSKDSTVARDTKDSRHPADKQTQGEQGKMGVGARVASTAAGVVCVGVGVPLLVLPGPGLVALGAGALLAASGISGKSVKEIAKYETRFSKGARERARKARAIEKASKGLR